MKGFWDQEYAETLAAEGCGDLEPSVMERDGLYYVMCTSTGIFFAPPLGEAALLELLFPEEWALVPPG